MTESGERPRGKGPAVWIVLAGLALLGGFLGARWWMKRQAGPAATAVPAAEPSPPTPAAVPAGPAPVVDAARVRSLLEGLSPSPLYRSWLDQADLVRRWAQVTENLAEGVVPRGPLSFLARAKPFAVVERGNRTFIAPDSYRRYDDLADAVASVDAQGFARVYRELNPVLDAAYRALGYPEGAFDRATAKALRRIEGAPVLEGAVPVVPAGALYAFADPKLENLAPVDRQVLRMGPRNARILQAKAREISQALALDPAQSPVPPR
jgi:hypothetical protein